MSKPLPKPVEAISEIRQLEASLPPGVIHEANHLDDRLIRKGVNQGLMARPGSANSRRPRRSSDFPLPAPAGFERE
jgi:hypothetical protein